MDQQNSNPELAINKPDIFTTEDIPAWNRHEWLNEVIGREYANVEITPPAKSPLFNEMKIYAWDHLRLSVIRSNSITIERLPQEPHMNNQDAYFGVILLSGEYLLEQNNREVFLKPGDMTIYDATRPHRIYCPGSFSKLIVSIPRKLMRERLAGVEHCTALRIAGDQGVGAVSSHLVQSAALQADSMTTTAFAALAESSLDLFTLALSSVRPGHYHLSRSRSLSLNRVKDFLERHLANPNLDTSMVVSGTGLSARYINELFSDEDTSLMRYIWQKRLERCHQYLTSPLHMGKRISEIAMQWGFNDFSHFSRAYKQKYDVSPKNARDSYRRPLNSA